MEEGDRIRVQHYCTGYLSGTKDYTVEKFRFCLGVFLTPQDREAQNFTPLCDLYEPAPDNVKSYIPNYGSINTKYVQSFMNLPKEQREEVL